MATFEDRWAVTEHVILASHIRGFARGLRNEVDDHPHPRLAIKQYTPTARAVQPGDASIVFAHGVGSTKESYEPFFDALLSHFDRIRSIWIPDVAWHGASYVLNEDVLGEEPHWADTARDLLQMINHFQLQMPPPIFGISQSWGAFHLLQTAQWHPRLFTGVVALEPTIALAYPRHPPRKHFAYGMAVKKDRWNSRDEARQYLLRNPYYGAFDPAVFDRVIKYDLRDVVIDGKPMVTLTTPKAMEVYTMMRPYPPLPNSIENPDHRLERLEALGLYNTRPVIPGFHRDEIQPFYDGLAQLRPSLLLVWGTRSLSMKLPEYRKDLMTRVGTGKDGSGGAAEGKVAERFVQDSGHPLPLEKPAAAAAAVGPWLVEELRAWQVRAEQLRNGPQQYTQTINPAWVERVNKL